MARTIYRVRWVKKQSQWFLMVGKEALNSFWTKKAAVAFGRVQGREFPPAQLVVHGKDGRINFEATYGADPKRYPS